MADDEANTAPAGVTHWDGPGLDAWHAWSPHTVARVLAGCSARWCVVGGHAIDLYLGRVTRVHEDLEIAVAAVEFDALRAYLRAFRLHAVGDGEVRALAADQPAPEEPHQTWVLDVNANAWRVDVMREPGDADTWVYRRHPELTAPRASMIGTRDGVPFLQAHAALLFKAKNRRPKDELDFRVCVPHLRASARVWLREQLTRFHPGHHWLAALQ